LILKKQGAERIVQDLKRRGQTPLLHEEESFLASSGWEQSTARAAFFVPNNSERPYGAE
jgi:hypothetical protein